MDKALDASKIGALTGRGISRRLFGPACKTHRKAIVYHIIGSDQKEYGPVSSEHIRQWIKERRLNRQTPAQLAGETEWKPLSLQPEFANDFAGADTPPVLPRPQPVAPAPGGDGINVIIPYKNMRALVAYYLAVFSLIPFVGILLGLAAFVLGILGLRFRRQNPTAGGGVHAWIGIVLGGLCGWGYLGLTIFLLVMTKTALTPHLK